MNAKLRRRLDVSERNTHLNRASVSDEVTTAALMALSNEELERLRVIRDLNGLQMPLVCGDLARVREWRCSPCRRPGHA